MSPKKTVPGGLLFAVLLSLAAMTSHSRAELFVSNLGNLWTTGGIGDIHGLFPGGTPYGTDTARFTTGSGTFSLNAITLEFLFQPSYPAGFASPQWISLRLFKQTDTGDVFLGSLGNPLSNPRPTQWPQASYPNNYTEFIDFAALGKITLEPFSRYSVVASMPADSPATAALLFTKSSAYTTPGDWTMGPTTSGNPSAAGEYLVMAVDASPIPEPHSAVLLLGGLVLLLSSRKSGAQKGCPPSP